MSNRLSRVRLAMRLVPATLLVVLAGTTAQAADPVAHFAATTMNINPGNGGKSDSVKIDLLRWSTDAERDQLFAAFKDEKQFLDVLQKMPTVGYVWTSGAVGFSVRYAYRSTLPGDVERIILATDRRIDSGGAKPWEATLQKNSKDLPFTVIELRLTKVGGVGKMSTSATVVTDADAKTIALEKFATAPVALSGVKQGAAATAAAPKAATTPARAPATGAAPSAKQPPPAKK